LGCREKKKTPPSALSIQVLPIAQFTSSPSPIIFLYGEAAEKREEKWDGTWDGTITKEKNHKKFVVHMEGRVGGSSAAASAVLLLLRSNGPFHVLSFIPRLSCAFHFF
jgi:hypothetical protein